MELPAEKERRDLKNLEDSAEVTVEVLALHPLGDGIQQWMPRKLWPEGMAFDLSENEEVNCLQAL